MAKIERTDQLLADCIALKEKEAIVAEQTGSKKPSVVATEIIQLEYLSGRGFKDYSLDSNCGLDGIDATCEGKPALQFKNTEQEKSEYTGGVTSPMHVIAEKAVACDENAISVFTRMKRGVVVDCIVGPASALLNWRTSGGNGVGTGNYNTLVRNWGFKRI
jgi:hypothetical protein